MHGCDYNGAGREAHVLVDTGASHTVVARGFILNSQLQVLQQVLELHTPAAGDTCDIERVYCDCKVKSRFDRFMIDLYPIQMQDFES